MTFLFVSIRISSQINQEKVFLDPKGVIRWVDTKKDVRLFGANYCLPSACDYRAAGFVSNDRKKLIKKDMLHFARMGWDGLRLCFWGDYENTDKEGNLLENDHLELLDYLIAEAKTRNIYMLLSPIVTYSSLWPDAMQQTSSINGISTHYKKEVLGIDDNAIKAQMNYLKQLLNHVNPYTGLAIKDEPSILFIEMINEPWHHSKDEKASVSYINKLVEAVESTGCKKILFHNVSQDFNMASNLEKSNIDGVSFAWYPSGLVSNHTLNANYLPSVDRYDLMRKPELAKKAKIVYEFDQPDLMTNYMYPAMTRTFRSVGAQFAAIFSYDMLDTAPYNLGWQTHYLNMVYTPNKAVSAIIAGQVMKNIEMNDRFDEYPNNTSFGPFKLDYENNYSEMLTDKQFIYSSSTKTIPKNVKSIQRIIGCGSSSFVDYEGKGLYFLDKLSNDTWRLELYPDAVLVDDPFKMPSPDKVVSRAIIREWPIKINLPDLGKYFAIYNLKDKKEIPIQSKEGSFQAKPGIYILTSNSKININKLPNKIDNIGLEEFVSPIGNETSQTLINISHIHNSTYFIDEKLEIKVDVFSTEFPSKVTVFHREKGKMKFQSFPLERINGYTYQGQLPKEFVKEGFIEYCIVVEHKDLVLNFPEKSHKKPSDWDFYGCQLWESKIIDKEKGLELVNPLKDWDHISSSRIGDNMRYSIFNLVPIKDQEGAAFRLAFPVAYDKNLEDYSIAIPVKNKLINKKNQLKDLNTLILNIRGNNYKEQAYLTLVDNEGKAWSVELDVKPDWEQLELSMSHFKPSKAPILPTGFPGHWNYWTLENNAPITNLKIENIEWVQFSLRSNKKRKETIQTKDSFIEVSSVRIKKI